MQDHRKPEGVGRRVADQLVGRPLRKLGEFIHEALEKAEAYKTSGTSRETSDNAASASPSSPTPSEKVA